MELVKTVNLSRSRKAMENLVLPTFAPSDKSYCQMELAKIVLISQQSSMVNNVLQVVVVVDKGYWKMDLAKCVQYIIFKILKIIQNAT